MKEGKVVLILIFLFFFSSTNLKSQYYYSLIDDKYLFNVTGNMREESKVEEIREKKSPHKARYIASVPGFLIHGLGHMYAGDYQTGALLFTLEVTGILMELSPVLFDELNPLVILGGGLLFWGTYIYDITGAPKAAQKYNERYFPENNTILQKHRILGARTHLRLSIKF